MRATDLLTAYGVVAVVSMLLFYALEGRHAALGMAFAGACLVSSAYGLLQSARPFGGVELVWSTVAMRRWQLRRGPKR
jgi:hypothetical protein